MGYSCTARAAFTKDAIQQLVNRDYPGECSNRLPNGGFWERGREQHDGAITGTCWRPIDDQHVRRAGSFKINADGTVRRFPGLPRALLSEAERIGADRYAEVYGG